MEKLISPSLLSADFLKLGEECDMINRSEAQWVHLDIMDGVFVPNISFGLPIVEAVRKATDKILDVHLMIADGAKYVEDFAKAGADIITVHVEGVTPLYRTVQQIKKLGVKAGVAVNPSTPLSAIEEILPEVDVVLLMTVEPGFGAQSFIESSYSKLLRLRAMVDSMGLKTIIAVDGGVTIENAESIYTAGAHCVVAGTAVFKAENPIETIKNIIK